MNHEIEHEPSPASLMRAFLEHGNKRIEHSSASARLTRVLFLLVCGVPLLIS
jgi:hypothetical protein